MNVEDKLKAIRTYGSCVFWENRNAREVYGVRLSKSGFNYHGIGVTNDEAVDFLYCNIINYMLLETGTPLNEHGR